MPIPRRFPSVPSASFPSSGTRALRFPGALAGLLAAAALPFLLSGCMEPVSPAADADTASANEVAIGLAVTTILQAENAAVSGALKLSANAGYTGTGYVDYQNASGDYTEWSATVGASGKYDLTFRYASATTRSLSITVNGATVSPGFAFPATASWTDWKTATLSSVQLNSGATIHIRLTAIGSSGPNLDYMSVSGPAVPAARKKVVAYLPNWYGSYSSWSAKVDYAHLTHINLCFGNPNSSGVTTLDNTDASIADLVNAAHAKGVKVLVSIGGATGLGDAAKWLGTGRATYIANLSGFVTGHALDGVDVDLEGDDVNADYGIFVSDLINNLRPKGKLVTAAVAPWFSDRITAATLKSFDFLNVMAYDDCGEWTSACEQATYASAQNVLDYYTGRTALAEKLVLGMPFYGWCWGTGCPATEMPYSQILSAYPDAYQKDWIQTTTVKISYNGRPTIQRKSQLARSYGGAMFWELPSDASGSSALLPLVANTLWAP
ncbi:MAG: Chitinase [Fibrobacteres bacterium]|nr:Chitinase [Fibrobacterota bacterium]